jgi:hypothetical protein
MAAPQLTPVLRLLGLRTTDILLIVAWAGLWVHELHRVPTLFGLTPDGSLPFAAVIAVLIAWKQRPAILLLGYGWLHLLGAITTVLPLPFLPFLPEQTLSHYVVHAAYAVAQVPLLLHAHRRRSIGLKLVRDEAASRPE